jgi:hypothetical protein
MERNEKVKRKTAHADEIRQWISGNGLRASRSPTDRRFGGMAISLDEALPSKYPRPARQTATGNRVQRTQAESPASDLDRKMVQLRSGDSFWSRTLIAFQTYVPDGAQHHLLLVLAFGLSFFVGTAFCPDFYYSGFGF